LGSLAFIVFLSLGALPAVRAVLEHESNVKNFALLASLTVVDIGAVLIIFYQSVPMFFYIIVAGLLGIVGGWYNYWFCERVDKAR
jgi:hypothetical protein